MGLGECTFKYRFLNVQGGVRVRIRLQLQGLVQGLLCLASRAKEAAVML